MYVCMHDMRAGRCEEGSGTNRRRVEASVAEVCSASSSIAASCTSSPARRRRHLKAAVVVYSTRAPGLPGSARAHAASVTRGNVAEAILQAEIAQQ